MEKRSLLELPDNSPSVVAVNQLISGNCAL
jgi:hypothetical protein